MNEATNPSAVVDQFQRERRHEVRESTITDQKCHLRSFVEWTEEIELGDVTHLNGCVVNQYKTWQQENSDINDQTLYKLEENYDERTEDEKADLREGHLDNLEYHADRWFIVRVMH